MYAHLVVVTDLAYNALYLFICLFIIFFRYSSWLQYLHFPWLTADVTFCHNNMRPKNSFSRHFEIWASICTAAIIQVQVVGRLSKLDIRVIPAAVTQ